MTKKVVDLETVRRARHRLEQLAKEHPELTGERGEKNRDGWLTTLEEDAMANTTQYTFRLPDDLIERLDAYAGRLSEETGIEVNRADVVKRLLTKGLEAVEKPKKPAPRK
jgi:hypothetical protein